LPKVGDRVPLEKFHVSKMNMRWQEPFGESEEDKLLIANLRGGKIIGPFKARPEDKNGHWKPGMDLDSAVGYGVPVGRRRFLGKKATGAKHFVVGTDCIIEEMTDEEAREASLIENLDILQKDVDPIARAKTLSEAIAFSPTGLRGAARRWGIPASTLSEWLQVLELSPKMQEAVSKGSLPYSDARRVARMKLGEELQGELVTVAESEGLEAFKEELTRIEAGKEKRGIPKGVYDIIRITWDKRYKPDIETLEKLDHLAETKKMKRDECAKWIIEEHVKSAA